MEPGMRYISLSQLSALLGNRGRTSIYRDIQQGRLPQPMKFGARIYWNEEQALAAVETEAQRVKTHSSARPGRQHSGYK